MGIVNKEPVAWVPYLWPQPRPATRAEVAAAEKELGISFPADYVAVAMQHQGEMPSRDCFEFSARGRTTASSMGPLLHFVSKSAAPESASYNIVFNCRHRARGLPAGVVPFSEDGGGNAIAFDFRKSRLSPPVVFVDHESMEETDRVLVVAANFSAFLDLLQEGEDDSPAEE